MRLTNFGKYYQLKLQLTNLSQFLVDITGSREFEIAFYWRKAKWPDIVRLWLHTFTILCSNKVNLLENEVNITAFLTSTAAFKQLHILTWYLKEGHVDYIIELLICKKDVIRSNILIRHIFASEPILQFSGMAHGATNKLVPRYKFLSTIAHSHGRLINDQILNRELPLPSSVITMPL